MESMGNRLAKGFHMKKDIHSETSGRWATEWGNKTGKGLFLTILRMAEEINEGKAWL